MEQFGTRQPQVGPCGTSCRPFQADGTEFGAPSTDKSNYSWMNETRGSVTYRIQPTNKSPWHKQHTTLSRYIQWWHLARVSLGTVGLFHTQRFADGRGSDPGGLLQVSSVSCSLFCGFLDGQASSAGHDSAGRRLFGFVGRSSFLGDYQSIFSFFDVDGFVVCKPWSVLQVSTIGVARRTFVYSSAFFSIFFLVSRHLS